MKTVIKNQYEECVGCSVCVQVCPKSCITMKTNHEGFWYPYVYESLCNDCGLCRVACPVSNDYLSQDRSTPLAFAAKNSDQDIRVKSSSGGVFSVLANRIIEEGGVVIGAAFNDYMRLEHVMVDSVNALDKLRGSKYVQSDLVDVFSEARRKLERGHYVLFSGTPCQVAGLYSFLGHDYRELLTCDLICHGVPSPQLYEDYLQNIERRRHSKVVDYRFRDKKMGWKRPSVVLHFENGTKDIRRFNRDSFTIAFSKNISLRMSCYQCRFSKIPRVADITLADFWGVSNYHPEMDDNKGTSLVLTNSGKGESWFSVCSDALIYKQVDLEEALKNNKNATGSVRLPVLRDKFFDDYAAKGYEFVERKYMRPYPVTYRAFMRVKNMVMRMRQ